jgi:hypothetical protein
VTSPVQLPEGPHRGCVGVLTWGGREGGRGAGRERCISQPWEYTQARCMACALTALASMLYHAAG